MKRIFALLPFALLSGAVQAADGDELLRTPHFPQTFGEHGTPDYRPLQPGSLQLTVQEIDRLILPRSGEALSLPSIDRFAGNEAAPLRFRPLSLFADGARIRVIGSRGETEQLRPQRQYYVANGAGTGIGLAVDPVSGEVSGVATRGRDRLKIGGDFVTGIEFTEIIEPDEASSACGNDDHDLSPGLPAADVNPLAVSASGAEAGTSISYQAVVAIETDSEWLDGFGDDRDAAMEYIADLFLAMNVFYERDIETRLLIGDVILRTGSDPYSVQNDRYAQLREFGEYWMDQMDHIDRQFAAMLSGRNISQWGFSGIAWVNAYCSDTNGYSYNAIGSRFSAAGAAHYVGHELGHNLGSPHTHCYSPAVDQCSNSGNNCYNGATSCPADGSGTVMSYCHGLGGCRADSEFHPTVQANLENQLASQMVRGCIAPYTETNPEPEFQSVPSAGVWIEFGAQTIGQTGPMQNIQVQNVGDADLTLSCGLSGSGQVAFAVESCPAVLAPAQYGGVQVSCSPGAAVSYQATLTVLTNDSDEGLVEFELHCTGVAEPNEDRIFSGSFES